MRPANRPGILTRRNLIQTGSAMLALAPLPAKAAAAPAAISPIMAKLSAYMAEAANHPLPDAVAEKTKQMILDALAAMISGSELPPASRRSR